MQYQELTKELKLLGWWNTKRGNRHEKWTNGTHHVAVPRHGEIANRTAFKIIKQAELYNRTGKLFTVFQSERSMHGQA